MPAPATKVERDLIVGACIGGTPNSEGFVRVNCPVCPSRYGKPDSHHSLGFRSRTGGFRCFRCHVNGRIQGGNYIPPEEADAHIEEKPKVIIDRSSFFSLWQGDLLTSPVLADARRFLKDRGIHENHWETADIHAATTGKYANRVIVPHRDENGEWWGFTSRKHPTTTMWGLVENSLTGRDDDSPKVLYPKNMERTRMYNDQVLQVETDKPAMVVEGCLDAVWYLPDAVAALGKPTKSHFDSLVSAKRPIVFCLDGDAWEEGRAFAYRLRLRNCRAGFVKLPALNDPNSVDPNWLRDQVANADIGEPCRPSNHSPASST